MATGDTFTDLGTKFKMASGKPVTEDQTGYGALVWSSVGGVVSLPLRGDSVEDIQEPTLTDGRNEHFGGLKDGGVLEIPIKYIEADAGQVALVSAAGTNDTYAFQEVDLDNNAHFYFGRVFEMKRREATTSSNKGYILKIAVNSARFTGTEES